MSFSDRQDVVAVAKKMSALGLSRGTSGNVSARTLRGMVVTPSGMAYDAMAAGDLVDMRVDGRHAPGERTPTSEWRLHGAIYEAREDVGGIVHAHAMFSTTLACLRMEIPAVHYMIAITGAAVVRCARYATFGSEELAQAGLEALGSAKACLLANHGMIAVGADVNEALKIAIEVETVAEQYWRALQIGRPVILDDAEMARVGERFKTYGQAKRRWGGG